LEAADVYSVMGCKHNRSAAVCFGSPYRFIIPLEDFVISVAADSGDVMGQTTVMVFPWISRRNNREHRETIFVGASDLVGVGPRDTSPFLQRLSLPRRKARVIWEKGCGRTGMPIFIVLKYSLLGGEPAGERLD
jgi:hypothetical protein